LFWDVDPDRIDLEEHRDFVLERVMVRGDWVASRWLIRAYPASTMAEFLDRRGARLPPREEAFWSLVCRRVVAHRPGGGRPAWAGP
jgi:hypothetical protein